MNQLLPSSPSSIKILPDALVNQIAAGEVVERPVSVVKELVENAIDASSDQIHVEFKNGGQTLISVMDNGVGMSEDDLLLSVERHATSKIQSFDDFERILSFGFRGEALAAIASVSKLEMMSCVDEQKGGAIFNFEAGTLKTNSKIGFPKGTRIIVRDLFFNTPARLKFLRSERIEASRILEWLQKISLAHPHIGFQITHNRNSQILPKGEDFSKRLSHILPKELFEKMVYMQAEEGTVKLEGFFLPPEFAKETRSHQWIYINNRYVQSFSLVRAVYLGLNTFLMKNRHPIFFIKLAINPRDLDINVHPAKTEVKIQNESWVSTFISDTLRHHLRLFHQKNIQNHSEQSLTEEKEDHNPHPFAPEFKNQPNPTGFANKPQPLESKNEPSRQGINFFSEQTTPKALEPQPKTEKLTHPQERTEQQIVPLLAPGVQGINLGQNLPQYTPQTLPTLENRLNLENLAILGRFDKYILAKKEETLWLIDAHAAHERFLYEKFSTAFKEKKIVSVPLLQPVVIKIAPFEQFLWEIKPEFWSEIGFDLRDLGGRDFSILALPEIVIEKVLHRISPEQFFHSLFEDLSGFEKTKNLDHYYHNVFASLACHSAVRGKEELSKNEMQILANHIHNCDLDLYCPHGRPILLKFHYRDFDKMFKRL